MDVPRAPDGNFHCFCCALSALAVSVGYYKRTDSLTTEPSRRLFNAGYVTSTIYLILNNVITVVYAHFVFIISVVITYVCSRETIRTFLNTLIAGTWTH